MHVRNRCNRVLAGVAMAIGLTSAHGAIVTGDLFYTLFSGGQNVNKIQYNYNETTQVFSLGGPVNVASTNGADGIIFAPNGNLLVGGQTSGNVYEVNPTGGAVLNTVNTGAPSYHLSLDPTGTKVYTSDFGGALKTMNVSPILAGPVTTTTITGSETGVTQVAFSGTDSYYVQGNPNGNGNVGHINVATGVTTRLFTTLGPAHGLIFDSFTDLMTMFGDGETGTFNPNAGTDANIIASLKVSNPFTCGFDQGAVDGKGHALVAGCSQITFIDYHLSGDITKPDYFTSVGGFSNIDDVAPLSGLGSNNVPEPASLALVAAALAGLGIARARRQR